MIVFCFLFQVESNDSLPSVICSECRNRVVQWNRFVIKCKKVELILNAFCGTLREPTVGTATTESPDLALRATVKSILEAETRHDVAASRPPNPAPAATVAATTNLLDDETAEAVLFMNEGVVSLNEADGFVSVVEKDFEESTALVSAESLSINIDGRFTPSATSAPETCAIVASQAKVDSEQAIKIDRIDVFMDAVDQDELEKPVPTVKSFDCNHCSKTYKSKHRFKEHVATAHDSPMKHICEQCSKV